MYEFVFVVRVYSPLSGDSGAKRSPYSTAPISPICKGLA